jgi:hypothetical protein
VFEYHGWVCIHATAAVEDFLEDFDEQAVIDRLWAWLEPRLSGLPYLADLRWMNGTPFLHVSGKPNHRGRLGDEILEIFRQVGRLAPGSYGLLYIWDDEDPRFMNHFRVYRLVRGEVTEHPDHLLSPAIPTLEDEDIPT